MDEVIKMLKIYLYDYQFWNDLKKSWKQNLYDIISKDIYYEMNNVYILLV